jgi:hypothetical protein
MSGKIYYVDPKEVVIDTWVFKRDIEYQKKRLAKEGQIVPLVCLKDPDGNWTPDEKDYHSAGALVHAARDLGFETILITDDPGEDN